MTTGVPGLNRNDAYRVDVSVPTPSEQRHIVELLDQADALQRKRTDADVKAERILPTLFLKMFGDPATNPKGFDVLPLEIPALACSTVVVLVIAQETIRPFLVDPTP